MLLSSRTFLVAAIGLAVHSAIVFSEQKQIPRDARDDKQISRFARDDGNGARGDGNGARDDSKALDQWLTHTSGIAASAAADGLADRDAAVRAILAEPLGHPPGESYHYEDEDYTILAAIVEVASGKPFETFVERSLLIPAGLSHTGFC